MRRPIALAGALVVAFSATALAQSTLPTPQTPMEQARSTIGARAFGSIDFGGRFTDISGDKARYQRYRDLRDGAFARNFLFGRRTADWTVEVTADNIGYRDQKFTVDYRQVGRLKASFVWDQIPLFISGDTRTLYSEVQPGIFRLEDTLQARNEAGTTTLRDYVNSTAGFELRTRRDTSAINLVYSASRDVDLTFSVTSAQREGHIPYGAPFGFNNAVELPVPIDSRTTDASTMIEWANQKGLVSVGWDGSWYDNAIETLIWDNPLKINDSPAYATAYSDGRGPAQGRMALWPDSNQQYVHGTASVVTPGRGRLTGYFAVGQANQNAPLLPHTINSQIPVIPLERETTEGEVRNTVFNLQYSARPVNQFLFVARYRYVDVDNRTHHFETVGRVRFDGVLDDAASSPEPEPYSVTRKNFDADATFTVVPAASIRVGYSNAIGDRTFRHWEETTENTFRVSFDTTGNQVATFRALFENSSREGSGLDLHVLEAVSEQPGMRQFDIADRDRRRATLLATFTPNEYVGVNASVGVGREEYPNSEFGLQEFDSTQMSLGIDVFPNDRVSVNAVYAREQYDSLQLSRTASPAPNAQWFDPRRNWFTDYDGTVNNLDVGMDVAEIAPRTNLRLSVNWSDATDTYNYVLTSDTVLTTPRPLAPVVSEILRGSIDVAHRLSDRLQLGASYWYENYKVEDFALGPDIASALVLPPLIPGLPVTATNTVLLGYIYRPYTAHTGLVRLTYLW
ncbi:MAG: MtrB/PioB family outer membrane beta-barrel protein [Acidobacteriota bacterium]